MKIAVNPAVTSSAAGTSPSSSRLRALSTLVGCCGRGSGRVCSALSAASSAALTSASACAFCVRGTRADRPALERAERRRAPRVQRAHVRVLHLVDAVELLGDQLRVVDQLDLRSRRARARAQARAATRGTRRRCWSPRRAARWPRASSSPSGVVSTAAPAAGPGFPREPPSTWMTSFTPRCVGDPSPCSAAKLSAGAPPAAVAQLAPLRLHAGSDGSRLRRSRLATVDDDRDVGLVGVVRAQRLEQLVLEFAGHDRVDHARQLSHSASAQPTT